MNVRCKQRRKILVSIKRTANSLIILFKDKSVDLNYCAKRSEWASILLSPRHLCHDLPEFRLRFSFAVSLLLLLCLRETCLVSPASHSKMRFQLVFQRMNLAIVLSIVLSIYFGPPVPCHLVSTNISPLTFSKSDVSRITIHLGPWDNNKSYNWILIAPIVSSETISLSFTVNLTKSVHN